MVNKIEEIFLSKRVGNDFITWYELTKDLEDEKFISVFNSLAFVGKYVLEGYQNCEDKEARKNYTYDIYGTFMALRKVPESERDELLHKLIGDLVSSVGEYITMDMYTGEDDPKNE